VYIAKAKREREREREGGGGGGGKRRKAGTRREYRGSRNWEGKKKPGKRCNEILANAFVFATRLHRDVRMEVIGIPRVLGVTMAYVNMPASVCVVAEYR